MFDTCTKGNVQNKNKTNQKEQEFTERKQGGRRDLTERRKPESVQNQGGPCHSRDRREFHGPQCPTVVALSRTLEIRNNQDSSYWSSSSAFPSYISGVQHFG